MRFFYSVFPISLTALLSLSACSSPGPMPTGYTYHQEVYKSPPAEEADSIGYEFSTDKNRVVMEMMHDVALDLITKMEQRFIIPEKEVYLKPTFLNRAQAQSFDHALRAQLKNRGYILVQTPEDGVAMTVHLEDVSPDKKTMSEFRHSYNFGPVRTTLEIAGPGTNFVMKEIYIMPLFGYVPDIQRSAKLRVFPLDVELRDEPAAPRPVDLRPDNMRGPEKDMTDPGNGTSQKSEIEKKRLMSGDKAGQGYNQ